jgi:hypothetical protein
MALFAVICEVAGRISGQRLYRSTLSHLTQTSSTGKNEAVNHITANTAADVVREKAILTH